MICHTLFSGSSGNSIYIKEKNTEILIDAGQSMKKISEELENIGTSLENISAIWVTHEHSDHTKALPAIAKKYGVNIYCLEEVAKEIYFQALYSKKSEDAKYLAKCIKTIETKSSYDSGDIEITPFSTPHDSMGSCGYVIGDNMIGIATDLGHISDEVEKSLLPCKNVILESNYDETMLKCGSYPPYLKERILAENGHLDNNDCADFSAKLMENGCESITLFHISKDNNTPDTAFHTVEEKLILSGGKVGKDIILKCAERYGETKII